MAANENFHQNTEKTFPWNPAMIRVVNDVWGIEDLHVTSSMTSPMVVAAMLEVFFSRRVGRFNGNNMPFFRADRNVPMHQIKPELRCQDLEGIHLPSFRFSWKLKTLCRVDFFGGNRGRPRWNRKVKPLASSAVF
jgi:hypothetical protein